MTNLVFAGIFLEEILPSFLSSLFYLNLVTEFSCAELFSAIFVMKASRKGTKSPNSVTKKKLVNHEAEPKKLKIKAGYEKSGRAYTPYLRRLQASIMYYI